MDRARRQLWLVAILFVAIGTVIGVAYQKYRAGDIQAAEGRREYEAGRFDLAETSYLRATQARPNSAEAWYWLGMSRKNQGLSAAAAEALGKATSLKPDRAAWWVEYAEALQWADRFADAEQAWKRVAELLPPDNPRIRQARMNIARNLGAQGRIEEAVKLLETLLTEKEDRQTRFLLAEVLAWGGRFEESARQYRQALDSKPEK